MEETTMKKILYTLIATLLLISCQDDMMHSLPTTDEGLVTLNVSLQVPEMKKSESRAFGETNLDYMASCSLQMVVFDGNGYLREWLNPLEADAQEGSIGISHITKNAEKGQIDFKVTLSKAVSYRNIHFIVNSPKSSYDFGDEATLISSLSVALNEQSQDAYWQQVAFPNGIDNDDATKALMARVPMIRNFAKITVEDNADKFTLEGFAVVNVWDKGTVAPYKGDGVFAALNTNERMKDYMTITKDGYEGIWPSDAELVYDDPSKVGKTEHPLTTNVTTEGTTTLTPFYMYERRNTYVSEDIPATYLLIKGTYNDGEYWYKLDLVYDVDAEGDMVTSEEQKAVRKQYYNILRNFHYQISIDDVSGPGYGSPEAAANHAASNNLSGSIDIRDLTNISDAVNRLFVSYTDTTLVDNGTVTVRYKYVPNSTTDSKSNADVSIIELTEGQGIDRMTKFERANTDDADGWRSVEVTFDGIPSNWDVITNTLSFNIDGLTREVDFNLRKKMYMIVECDPLKVPLGVKEEVAGNILIPVDITSEEDPYQFFPLEFLIEAENLTISPNVTKNINDIKLSPYEMPVESGTSIIPAKKANNRQTFRYKRTITNAEYQDLETKPVTVNYNGESISGNYKVIPCNFLTNTTVSASKVYAQNEYFTLIKEGEFENTILSNASLSNTSANYGIGVPVTLTFETTEDNVEVKITLTGLKNQSNETSFNYTCEEAGVQSITLYSTSVLDTEKAVITYDGEELEAIGLERKKPSITNAALSESSKYYGDGNEVTLSFYIDQPGVVSINLNQGLTYSDDNGNVTNWDATNKIITYNCTSAGTQRITLESVGWSIQEIATVSLADDATVNDVAEGGKRNKLIIPANTIEPRGNDMGSYSREINITLSSELNNPIASFYCKRNNKYNRTIELTIDDLGGTLDDWNKITVYFYFTRNNNTYSDSTSMKNIVDLVNGDSQSLILNF